MDVSRWTNWIENRLIDGFPCEGDSHEFEKGEITDDERKHGVDEAAQGHDD